MNQGWDKRLKGLQERCKGTRTHYLWRERGESREDVRERFRQMVEEFLAPLSHFWRNFRKPNRCLDRFGLTEEWFEHC